jgi:hypothetical protein
MFQAGIIMKLTRTLGATAAALFFVISAQRAGADTKPLRHLEYTFTYGSNTTIAIDSSGPTNSAINPGDAGTVTGGRMSHGTSGASEPVSNSGSGTLGGSGADQGTIDVDVVALQPDSGLVVRVSEIANGSRSNPAATCVVYPNTYVICDPDTSPNDEETTLLRYLGRGFVNSAAIDAKNHWNITDSNPAMTINANYTIASASGNTLHIDESRLITTIGVNGGTQNTEGKIAYDSSRTVPLNIQTYEIERSEHGIGQVSERKTEIELSLTSDTMSQTSNN